MTPGSGQSREHSICTSSFSAVGTDFSSLLFFKITSDTTSSSAEEEQRFLFFFVLTPLKHTLLSPHCFSVTNSSSLVFKLLGQRSPWWPLEEKVEITLFFCLFFLLKHFGKTEITHSSCSDVPFYFVFYFTGISKRCLKC